MPKKPTEDKVQEAEAQMQGEVTSFEYNIFFRGPEGFGEHYKAVASNAKDAGLARMALVAQLLTLGAQPQIRDTEWKKPEAPKGSDSPAGKQWAKRDNGPQSGGGDECPNGCGPMKLIQNRQHKTNQKGRVWTDFMVCDTCKKSKNLKTIGGELPEEDDE